MRSVLWLIDTVITLYVYILIASAILSWLVAFNVVNVRNPVPPDQRSLEAGRQTYMELCAVCHGDTGRGDGPAGLRLVPRPADFRVHMAAGHTDGELLYWVTYGMAGTAMPAFGDQLTERERWDVINFIRTFAQTPSP